MRRVSLYLDEETIELLKNYSANEFGVENISQAVRALSRTIEEWPEDPDYLDGSDALF